MWRSPTSTTTHTTQCTPYTLPAGVVVYGSTTQTLSTTAVFSPLCASQPTSLSSTSSSTTSLKNPFYSSIIPIAYTIAGTTVLAWVLLLLLLVTPQTRPYLQKIATLTVAISVTIALAECTKILKSQYEQAYEDAEELRSYVDDGLTLKIFRVVSDVFLWLAQVQTLIRLFPRHREKQIIKWLGLALIVVDTVFWSLKSFLPVRDNDKSFRDAIPALAYLFQIILSLLYSAYVVYYSISKRVFAYHIKNLLLAVLSLLAVLTPIIFFLLDISRQWISGWGDFVRWVGAAAASVVVWEWVERIEYLESKEQESGVLGRQVFEDEMLETGTSRGARASGPPPPPPSSDSDAGDQPDRERRSKLHFRLGRRRADNDGDTHRLWFFGRPLSRATTGTSATSYRVNEIDEEETRVRHFHPLKRGLSRSTNSSSPLAVQSPRLSPSPSSPSPSHSPQPSVEPRPVEPSTQSPVPSVSFDVRSFRPSRLSHDADHQSDNHSDSDESDYVVTDPPPMFDRVAGFSDGDYYDEKAGVHTQVSPLPRSPPLPQQQHLYNRRAQLQPADVRPARRVFERITGVRDWVVAVDEES